LLEQSLVKMEPKFGAKSAAQSLFITETDSTSQ
jgi:hypothetical protein